MAKSSSAPAHTSPVQIAHAAGTKAARAWYSNPKVSLARARDFALAQYVAGINFSTANLPEIDAFEQGFAGGLSEAVFGGAK